MISSWLKRLQNPITMVRMHKYLFFLWVFVGIPVSWILQESVPWVVFLSVYAIFATHWSGWQGARTEVKQDEQIGS